MVVNDAEEPLDDGLVVLEAVPGLDGAEIVSEVEGACGLNTRKDMFIHTSIAQLPQNIIMPFNLR